MPRIKYLIASTPDARSAIAGCCICVVNYPLSIGNAPRPIVPDGLSPRNHWRLTVRLYLSMLHTFMSRNTGVETQYQEPAGMPTTAAPTHWRGWKPLLSLLATIALTLVLVAVPLDVEGWGAYGYAGAFILTLLSSATVLIPSVALGAALKFGAASTLNPVLVGLVSGVAAGLGESTGYLAGRSGAELAHVQDRPAYRRIARWVERRGTLTVFALAAIPLPLIDLAGIAAGALGMSFNRFLLACLGGKITRFIPVALLGYWLRLRGWL